MYSIGRTLIRSKQPADVSSAKIEQYKRDAGLVSQSKYQPTTDVREMLVATAVAHKLNETNQERQGRHERSEKSEKSEAERSRHRSTLIPGLESSPTTFVNARGRSSKIIERFDGLIAGSNGSTGRSDTLQFEVAPSVKAEVRLAPPVRDVFIDLNSRYRDRSRPMRESISWRFTLEAKQSSPQGIIPVDVPIANIIEMEIAGSFIVPVPSPSLIYSTSLDWTSFLGETNIEFPELNSQSIITNDGYKYHLQCEVRKYTTPDESGIRYTVTPRHKFIFSYPITQSINGLSLVMRDPFRRMVWLNDVINCTLDYTNPTFILTIANGTAFDTVKTDDQILFENYYSTAFNPNMTRSSNPFSPDNIYTATNISPTTFSITLSTTSTATDINRSGDATLSDFGITTVTVGYTSPMSLTFSTPHNISTGTFIVFNSFVFPSQPTVVNDLMTTAYFVATVTSATAITIPYDLSRFATASDRPSTATIRLYRVPTVRVYIITRQIHFNMRLRMLSEERTNDITPV